MISSLLSRRRNGAWPVIHILSAFILLSFPITAAAADAMTFQGSASWYGVTAHGRTTASGRVFNRVDYAAAHRTLPFGTVLRVHNLRNYRHVLVMVSDRGPFIRGRVVDVSMQAAKVLGFVAHGVASVWCEVVSTADGEPLQKDLGFYVQFFATSTRAEAEQHQKDIALRLGLDSKIFHAPDDPQRAYRVCSGYWPVFSEAETVLETLPGYYTQAKVILAPLNGEFLPPSTFPESLQEPSVGPAKKHPLPVPLPKDAQKIAEVFSPTLACYSILFLS